MHISDWSSDVCSSDLANALNLVAGDALEVILGQGSVRLVHGADPAGQLNMISDDIIVATAEAIADFGAATRSEERRVGTEWVRECCTGRFTSYCKKKNTPYHRTSPYQITNIAE